MEINPKILRTMGVKSVSRVWFENAIVTRGLDAPMLTPFHGINNITGQISMCVYYVYLLLLNLHSREKYVISSYRINYNFLQFPSPG